MRHLRAGFSSGCDVPFRYTFSKLGLILETRGNLLSLVWIAPPDSGPPGRSLPSALPWDQTETLAGYTLINLSRAVKDPAYTLTARPRNYAITGCLSLYADESGGVRATHEDREASKRDPHLGG